MRRRGFTLIEMLVVIALIAILGTMLVMAIGHMQTNGKRQQTRGIMANLSAMFADYDVNRRVPFGAGNLSPSLISSGNIWLACPQNVALDYNTAQEAGTMPTNTTPCPPGADRKGMDGNWAIPITRCFMAQLMSDPNNAASLGKLPASALMTFAGFDPSSSMSPAPLVWNMTTYYTVGQYVNDGNGNIYIRTQAKLDSQGNIQYDAAGDAPPNYYYWMPSLPVPNPTVLPSPPGTQGTLLSTPVFLDAWGNPIIFVMGGVLGKNTSPLYPLATDLHGYQVPPIGSGGLITNYGSASVETQVHSPDYHPFFASAGPDGDFSKGDDNLYSYEK